MRTSGAALLLSLLAGIAAANDETARDAPGAIGTASSHMAGRSIARVQAAPMRVEMSISVEARGLTVGEGRDVFEHDRDTYRVVSEARTTGVARLFKRVEERRESSGLVTRAGIRPLLFRQERTGKAPKTATFDWDKHQLQLQEGDDRETVPLPPLTLDQTSLTYAFVFVDPPRSGSFHVQVTDGRRLVDYEVAFVGMERIRSALGEVETLRYRKVQRGDDKRGFEFWLSTAHHHLPVRVRIVEKDGTAFDSNVTKLQYDGR
jgi:hypothetical protein